MILALGSLPIITDQWVQIRVEIDLDANTHSVYYNNQLLYGGVSWSEEDQEVVQQV